MGNSGDDAVHKIPHKMKTHWRNQLKISVLVQFKILYRMRYKKIACFYLSNAPLILFSYHGVYGVHMYYSVLPLIRGF